MDQAGLKKAATLLAVLSGREKERLLGELDSATAEALRGLLSRLGTIPTPVIRAVLAEFLAALKKPDSDAKRSANASLTETSAPTDSEQPDEASETMAAYQASESDSDLLFRLFGSNGSAKDYRIETKRQPPRGPHFSPVPLANTFSNRSNEEIGETAESSVPRGHFFQTLARLRPNEIFTRLENERPQTTAVVLAQFSNELAQSVLAEFPKSAAEEISGRIERLVKPGDEILAAMESALTTETR